MTLRLLMGWTMIVVGTLGMTVHLWITTTWLWYLLRRAEEPFGEWLRGVYC